MRKLPTNSNKNGWPVHDSTLDTKIIREFVRRFPGLRFRSFQRNGIGTRTAMHTIRFIGERKDLVAAGIPASAIKRALATGRASSSNPLDWTLSRDDRRKAGTLEAQFWVFNHGVHGNERPSDHPMTWLEPRHWSGGRCQRSALGEVVEIAPNVLRAFPDGPAIVNPVVSRYPRNVVSLESARRRLGVPELAEDPRSSCAPC